VSLSFCGTDTDKWGWILIPRWQDSVPQKLKETAKGDTAFWLPYRKDFSADVISRIESGVFERFDSLCLMFLRNIREIRLQSSSGKPKVFRLAAPEQVTETRDGTKIVHRYQLFR